MKFWIDWKEDRNEKGDLTAYRPTTKLEADEMIEKDGFFRFVKEGKTLLIVRSESVEAIESK